MSDGVEVAVDGGFATIDFVDPARRGPGLAALLEQCEPSDIEKLTGVGPRSARYRVPETVAKAAGLLDKSSRVEALQEADTSSATDATGSVASSPLPQDITLAQMRNAVKFTADGLPPLPDNDPVPVTYDDGLPDMDWSRQAINHYAATLTPPLDVTGEPNKRTALAAITTHIGRA